MKRGETLKNKLKKVMNEQVFEVIDKHYMESKFKDYIEQASDKEIYKLCLTAVLEQTALTIYLLEGPAILGKSNKEIQRAAFMEVAEALREAAACK